MAKPTVAILGASTNRQKYGNKSVRVHRMQGYDVFPINPNASEVEGIPAYARLKDLPVRRLNRVSVYLPPEVGITVLEEIGEFEVDEVWFNPGSDSPELVRRAEELGLPIIRACSMIGLGIDPEDSSIEELSDPRSPGETSN